MENNITIPDNEIEITTSRSGGPGGQHVNKSDTRITLRWNVKNTNILNDEQKERILQKLQNRLTIDGDLIIHSSASRSQQQNKKAAFERLAQEVKKALYVPKKRIPTVTPKRAKESRLRSKTHKGSIKKMRAQKIQYD